MRIALFIAELIRPVIWILLFVFPKFRERRHFEKSYRDQIIDCGQFDLTVHISSEGELELVLPVIEYSLKKNHQILLVFTSPSVVDKAESLREKYNTQISLALLRLCSFLPFSNAIGGLPDCDRFIMVRYDFFPDLINYGEHFSKKFILIAASLKGKENLRTWKEFVYRWIYQRFDMIICSTDNDMKLLERWVPIYRLRQYEFRIPRILFRTDNTQLLEEKPWYGSFLSKINSFSRSKRLILGSCWERDLEILSDPQMQKEINNGDWFVFFAPHKLDTENIDNLKQGLKNILGEKCMIGLLEKGDENINSNILICSIPGILCELYQFFGHAYIGGGFGRSVHSVLEPFWSCERIYIGPRTHRSTEVDQVREIDQDALITLKSTSEFYLSLDEIDSVDLGKRKSIGKEILSRENNILNDIF